MKKMKKLFAVLISLAMVLSLVNVSVMAEESVATPVTHGYDNLNNEAGDLVIGFIGGSITIGSSSTDRYATHVTNWFQEQYPEKTVTQVNAGMGGTPSEMGKYRIQDNICQYNPDVVFIEFAVNDAGYGVGSIKENVESMIRQLQALPKQPIIVLLYSYVEKSSGVEYADARDSSIPAHKAVADYYNVGQVDFFSHMNELVDAGECVWWDVLTNDGTHPNAEGHVVYADYITERLVEDNLLVRQEKTHTPYMTRVLSNPHLVSPTDESVVMTGTWEETLSTDGGSYSGWKSTATGDSISLTFTGNSIGIMHMNGTASWVLDEGTENEKSGTIGASTQHAYPTYNIFGRDLTGEHTLKITNTGTDEITNFRAIGFMTSDGYESFEGTVAENGDYIPGTMPAPLAPVFDWGNYLSKRNAGGVTVNWHTGSSIWKYEITADTALSSNYYAQGSHFLVTEFAPEGLKADTNYVIGFLAKDASTIDTPIRLNVGYAGKNSAPLEYGADGKSLSDEWERFGATFNTGSNTAGALNVGVPYAWVGQMALVNLKEGVYFAEEVAYDVTLEPVNSSVIVKGKPATFKAQLENQVGTTGSLPQGFTYAITDESGNAVDTITLNVSDDTKEVEVITTDATAYGTYLLKATDTTNNWQQTLEIIVADRPDVFEDSVPDESIKPANMITDPDFLTAWVNVNGAAGTYIRTWDETGDQSYFVVQELAKEVTYYRAGPSSFTVGKGYLTKGFTKGEDYVVSVRVKNSSPEKNPKIKFGVGLTYELQFSKEITNTEYETITGAFKASMDSDNVGVGLDGTIDRSAWTEDQLGTLTFDLSNGGSLYIAEEILYDMSITAEKASVIAGKDLEVKATALNQVGDAGNLAQDFSFMVLSEDRKTIITEGFTITEDENGAATIAVAETVAPGNYVVYATNEEDDDIAKGVEFTVVDATIYSDKLEEEPTNMFTQPDSLNFFTKNNGSSSFIRQWEVDGDETRFIWTEKIQEQPYYRAGSTSASIDNECLAREVVSGENYIVKARLKNSSPDVKESINFALCVGWKLQFAEPISNTEYEDYTIYFTSDTSASSVGVGIEGVDRSTWTEDQLGTLTIDLSNGGSLYLAEEAICDIINDFGGEDRLWPGESATLETSFVNQVGEEGTISQGVEYIVLNSERSEVVDDIEVVANGDGTATVTVADDAVAGEYVILAKSTDYENIQKGVTVNVISSEYFSDFEATEKAANIVADPDNVNAFYRSCGAAGSMLDYVSAQQFRWKEAATEAHSSYAAGPTYWTVGNNSLSEGLTKGTSYVVSANLKNDTFDTKPNLDFVLGYGGKNVAARFNVNSAEYKTYSAVFTANVDSQALSLGFDASIDRSDWAEADFGILNIDISNGGSIYIAEEAPYTMSVATDAEIAAGANATVETTILNQIGTEGNINQEVEWFVLTEDRSEEVENITVTTDAEGVATINVPADAVAGNYVVYARSAEYGIGKGATVAVTAAAQETEAVTSLELTSAEGVATLVANVENAVSESIMFVIASYATNGDVVSMNAVDSAVVTPVEGVAASGTLSIAVASGETVRAFIWNEIGEVIELAEEFVTELTVQ